MPIWVGRANLKQNQGPKVLESGLARGPLQCESECSLQQFRVQQNHDHGGVGEIETGGQTGAPPNLSGISPVLT
jgi:hypothetical protein